MPNPMTLHQPWTWKIHLPDPFNGSDVKRERTDATSVYNTTSIPKATLHGPALSGVLAYLNIDSSVGTPAPKAEHAIGTVTSDKDIAEYHSHSGEIHVVQFNRVNGSFTAARFSDATAIPQVYQFKESKQTGAALFFALMPFALSDAEFSEQYDRLAQERAKGYPDGETISKIGAILCDNLYRRIECASSCPAGIGIEVTIPPSSNIRQITPMKLNDGYFNPSEVIYGDFKVLTVGAVSCKVKSAVLKHDDFVGKYSLSSRVFSSAEQQLIPSLPDYYVIPPEVEQICMMAHKTSSSKAPMRNFMLRGPAGTGKTEGAKAVAAGLGLPYMFLTCAADYDKFDFIGQFVPTSSQIGGDQKILNGDLPTFQDIENDPCTAYAKLTGSYDENVSADLVYQELISTLEKRAAAKYEAEEHQEKGFSYVDTPFISALRHGYVIELQEPSIIANQGVIVGLNGLLDNSKSINLPTGEIIYRHPDSVVIITTNTDYVGCRPMNQSVLSRMDLIIDFDEPERTVMVQRVSGITGCTDTSMMTRMADALRQIQIKCRETAIHDGSCGIRELIAWVQTFMISGDALAAASQTVISSVSSNAENRAEISSYLETLFA